jgi:tungstate transport system ATP-binding protein
MHATNTALPLRLDAVSLTLGGKPVVQDLSFEIRKGRRTMILGPNGAGKSLTLRLCHGLVRPTSGTVSWLGPARDARGRHAMVFQRPVLLRRSAEANVGHALAVAGAPRAERRTRAREALERFGLTPFAGRAARTLSGGEQQRLAIARAWALAPEVLFLDEPTSALDPAATRAVEAMVEACHADGMTIVMTTHDLGQARRLGDEVLFLHHGRLHEAGPAAEFFAGPHSAEGKAFLGGDLLW